MKLKREDSLIPEYNIHKRPRIRWLLFIKYLFGVSRNVIVKWDRKGSRDENHSRQ